MLMCQCGHSSYVYFHRASGVSRCWKCKGVWIGEKESKEKEYLSVVMPKQVGRLTPKSWSEITPWPRVDYDMARLHRFYTAFIHNELYIVMPIYQDDQPVFYSARKVNNDSSAPKYSYPKGAKKHYWVSPFRNIHRDPVVICEGIADAVYVDRITDAVALLGTSYDGSLDTFLKDRKIVLLFDSDIAGALASLRAIWKLPIAKEIRIATLPSESDPNELSMEELNAIIFNNS